MIKLDIISPERRLFCGEVNLLRLPGTAGAFTVLTGHAPIVASLSQGTLSFLTADAVEHQLQIKGGFVEVSDNRATLCVEEDTADGRNEAGKEARQ